MRVVDPRLMAATNHSRHSHGRSVHIRALRRTRHECLRRQSTDAIVALAVKRLLPAALVALVPLLLACSSPKFQAEPGAGGAAAGSGGSSGSGGGAGSGGGPGGASGASGSGGTAGAVPAADYCQTSDCKDPRCAPIPDVPSGWKGPLLLSNPVDTSGKCPDDYSANIATAGKLVVPPGSCQSCACNAGTLKCDDPDLHIWTHTNTTCAGAPTVVHQFPSSCYKYATGGKGYAASFGFTKPKVSGVCGASSVGSANLPDPYLDQPHHLCLGTPGTDAGGSCAPQTKQAICVAVQSKGASCPAGYPNAQDLVEGILKKNRSCETCSCGQAQGSCDGTRIDANYPGTTGSDCGSTKLSVQDSDGGCKATGSTTLTQYFSFVKSPSLQNPSCAPNKPKVVDEIQVSGSWTVCCTK